MSSAAAGDARRSAGAARLAAAAALAGRLLRRLERARPLYVVGALVGVQWLVTLGLALTVRHNGWVWYQGGDQVWFYTSSWLLVHGHVPLTLVGYAWSIVLLPLTLVGGPNLLQVMPAIVLVNVLVLMPAAMAALYGIGERLGGRLAGYWVLAVWIAAPLVGIRYTNAGFHQRYTEITLPQAYGLTALADFPSLVALAGGAYFLVRIVQRFSRADAALAGALIAFAIGIKPANALVLPGIALALLLARRWRAGLAFSLALAPGLLVLALWKWRGLGYLPVFHAEHAVRLAAGAAGAAPLAAVGVQRYLHFDWNHVQTNLDSIREHFWSVRVFEWLVIAGVLALARRALWVAGLFGGWFLAFVLIKGSDPVTSIQDTSLLRLLIPAIAPFVLMLAALPLLVPGVAGRLPAVAAPRPWGSRRTVGTVLAAAGLVTVVLPAALIAAAHRVPDAAATVVNRGTAPIPTDDGFRLRAAAAGRHVRLSWPARTAAAGRVFYTVLRGSGCTGTTSIDLCAAKTALTTRETSLVDSPPGPGTYVYVVGVSANWQDDGTGGDPYVASRPAAVTVP
jgi:hypothetical protein